MPLCRPKTKTPALLAACRANARKGTGPRTAEGKCRSRLNALKHGRYSTNFRENLVQAGRKTGVERFDFIRSHLLKFLPPVTQVQKREAEELARRIWCWVERKEKIGRKQRCSMDSANYQAAALPFSRFQIRDKQGRTMVTVTLGYQRRRTGDGRSVARVALTLTPGKGSEVYQEQQAVWRSAWVLSKMPVLMTGARPIPKSFKELEQAIAAHAAGPPVTAWRPEVVIRLCPARYREPHPWRPRRRPTVANCSRIPSGNAAGREQRDSGLAVRGSQEKTANRHGLFANPEPRVPNSQPALHGISGWISRVGTRVGPQGGWMAKLLGLFRRKRAKSEGPERPELHARGPEAKASPPSALDDPPLSRGHAYGKDSCRVLGHAEFLVALSAHDLHRPKPKQ